MADRSSKKRHSGAGSRPAVALAAGMVEGDKADTRVVVADARRIGGDVFLVSAAAG
jgi:hypothetical protein